MKKLSVLLALLLASMIFPLSALAAPGLQYELTEDKSGYCIIGFEGNPTTIRIPATYLGLPVKAFKPGAFRDCDRLTAISVEEGNTSLYVENSALYADLTEKTLLCYPAGQMKGKHYYVADGTCAIAPYAFSRCALAYVTIPQGVIRMGDCAFYGLKAQLTIYMPDSLTVFGDHLFQNQEANAAIYASSRESAAAIYASQNKIPFGVIVNRTPEPTNVPTPTPQPNTAMDIPPVDADRIVYYHANGYGRFGAGNGFETFDISGVESDDASEVRLTLNNMWSAKQNCRQTGLYGAGHTEQEAILRAYNMKGELVGAQKISGNFSFCFDGASSLGVAGGKGTRLTVLPTKPIYISQPGRYPMEPEKWHKLPDGNIYQNFVLEMPNGMVNYQFPYYLNIMSSSEVYSTVRYNPDQLAYSLPHYVICGFYSNDSTRVDQLDVTTHVFDYMLCFLDTEEVIGLVASVPERSADLAESISEVYQMTRAEMLAGHYPISQEVKRVQVLINGTYPSAVHRTVWLDGQFFIFDDEDVCTLAHELVHAIDEGIRAEEFSFMPMPWMEGRAEYISKQICEQAGVPYTSQQYGDGKHADWSFISETDRKDFQRYYMTSTNRETQYMIGYYFYTFLMDTYGTDIGAIIMENIANAQGMTEENDEDIFLQCVESATEPGVFQRFVEEVIVPSGT